MLVSALAGGANAYSAVFACSASLSFWLTTVKAITNAKIMLNICPKTENAAERIALICWLA